MYYYSINFSESLIRVKIQNKTQPYIYMDGISLSNIHTKSLPAYNKPAQVKCLLSG